MAEIVFKQEVQDYVARHVRGLDLGQAYTDAFREFIDDWQDPETGYWGVSWHRIGGGIRKATDLSFTYHIIAYRQGDVRYWDRIIATTLALEDQEYPFGWRYQGQLTNHNAYDVVRIFQSGWPHMDADQRGQSPAAAIDRMLHWSLTREPAARRPVHDAGRLRQQRQRCTVLRRAPTQLTKAGACLDPAGVLDRPHLAGRPRQPAVASRASSRPSTADIPAAEAARRRLAVAYPRCCRR